MSNIKKIPATLFRTSLDCDYYNTLVPKLRETEMGTRICNILDSKFSDVRKLNTFMSKCGFIYVLANLSRGATLSEADQSKVQSMFDAFEVNSYGCSEPTADVAV